MAARVKIGGKSGSDYDLLFVFNNVKLFVLADPDMYNDNDVQRIEEIVHHMSREIIIDKSYVSFPENKHRDTFLELDGWNNLCKLLKRTKFGKKSTDTADEVVMDALKAMILAYMYDILEKFGYDIEGINIDFLHGNNLNVKFYKDGIQEWKQYVGPWQEWNLEK